MQIILHFFVFLLHIARLVYHCVSAHRGPQYDKEQLCTVCVCKGTIKNQKAQRFDPLRPN